MPRQKTRKAAAAPSHARSPMAVRTSRAGQRAGAPATSADIPAYIYAAGTGVSTAEKDYLRRKLGRRLGKFATQIQRVSVRLQDANGPRGGVDQYCRIKVTLRGLAPVVVEARRAVMRAAMDSAVAMADTAVKRATTRRRAPRTGAAAPAGTDDS